MGRDAVFKWWKRFRDGETNVKEELLSDQEVKTTCSTSFLKFAADGLHHVIEK
jgi:hypothetical protein